MPNKLKHSFFYLLLLVQMQLDLLFFQFNLQGLLAILLYLFVYYKKQNWYQNSFVAGLIFITCFITSKRFLGFEIGLILASFLLSKFLNRNLNFKLLNYQLVLIIYLISSHYLANCYLFGLEPSLTSLAGPILLNLAYSSLIIIPVGQKS